MKVLDFGLAKPFGGGEVSQLTVEGVTLGTPEYMAPEVARAEPHGRRTRRSVRARVRRLRPADRLARLHRLESRDRGAQTHADAAGSAVAAHDQIRSAGSRTRDSGVPRERSGRPSSSRPRASSECSPRATCRCGPRRTPHAWWQRHLPPTSPLRSFSQDSAADAVARAESVNMQTSEPRTLVTHPELRSHQSLPVFKTLGEPAKEAGSSGSCRSSPTCAPAKASARCCSR